MVVFRQTECSNMRNVEEKLEMPSLQSKLLYFMMMNRHLLRFHLKREPWDWNTSIPAFRQECEEGAQRAGKMPAGIEVRPVTIDVLPADLSAEWILPARCSG